MIKNNKNKNKILFFVLISIILFGTLTITSVRGLEAFSGYVKDRLGNPISGATVTLTDSQNNLIWFTSTNAYGYYSFSTSLSGNSPYDLTAGKTAYQTSTITVTGGGQNDFNLYALINGYVKSSINQPIASVTVEIFISGISIDSTTTQTNGYYSILLDSSPTSAQIKTEKHGYRDLILTISGSGCYDLNLKALFAVIVGISDYYYISDLSYGDEDATDWYNKLYSMGYECWVYGDGHISNYPRHDGVASENNVRKAIQSFPARTGSGDTFCFITAGHGGQSWFKQYLAMWDCGPYGGQYFEGEIADDFDAGVNLFFFFDNCKSGGILPRLGNMVNADYIYCAATCQWNGNGYDNDTCCNGEWTYSFLEKAWEDELYGSPSANMELIFLYADYYHYYTGADNPKAFDGDTGSKFYL
ncbi:MAG: carboxypeptidase regulatory-like domain-containing protein [Candidatus Heimdallarchaeota archaeon]